MKYDLNLTGRRLFRLITPFMWDISMFTGIHFFFCLSQSRGNFPGRLGAVNRLDPRLGTRHIWIHLTRAACFLFFPLLLFSLFFLTSNSPRFPLVNLQGFQGFLPNSLNLFPIYICFVFLWNFIRGLFCAKNCQLFFERSSIGMIFLDYALK